MTLSDQAIQYIKQHSITPNSPQSSIIAFIHSVLLLIGYSLYDLEKKEIQDQLPPTWMSNPNIITLRYHSMNLTKDAYVVTFRFNIKSNTTIDISCRASPENKDLSPITSTISLNIPSTISRPGSNDYISILESSIDHLTPFISFIEQITTKITGMSKNDHSDKDLIHEDDSPTPTNTTASRHPLPAPQQSHLHPTLNPQTPNLQPNITPTTSSKQNDIDESDDPTSPPTSNQSQPPIGLRVDPIGHPLGPLPVDDRGIRSPLDLRQPNQPPHPFGGGNLMGPDQLRQQNQPPGSAAPGFEGLPPGMQPRFDPYGPLPGMNRPNPDHQRRPGPRNNFGGSGGGGFGGLY